jgi:hypothetical protein
MFGVVISELARDGLTAGAISKRHNPEAGGCRKEYLFLFFFFDFQKASHGGYISLFLR